VRKHVAGLWPAQGQGWRSHRLALRFRPPAVTDLRSCLSEPIRRSRRGSSTGQRLCSRSGVPLAVKASSASAPQKGASRESRPVLLTVGAWAGMIGSLSCQPALAGAGFPGQRLLSRALGPGLQGAEPAGQPQSLARMQGFVRRSAEIVVRVISSAQMAWAVLNRTRRSRQGGMGTKNHRRSLRGISRTGHTCPRALRPWSTGPCSMLLPGKRETIKQHPSARPAPGSASTKRKL